MKYLLLFIIIIALFSCVDDDYSKPLVYTLCTNEIVEESSKIEQVNLSVLEWPDEIRTYISIEFPGFSISKIETYKIQTGIKFFQITMNNDGFILFDEESNFICGDNSFTIATSNDEHINYEDLPQKIKDYILENYPNTEVKKAEFEDGEYEIELKDGTELCFNAQGDFLGEC